MGYRMDKSELKIVDMLVEDKLAELEDLTKDATDPAEKVEKVEAVISLLEFQVKYMAKLDPDAVEDVEDALEEWKAELQVVLEEVEV